jgi:biotin synthase
MLDPDAVLEAARETAKLGATEFCIVLAVRGPNERIMTKLIELTNLVRQDTGLNVAISAGILTREQSMELARAGVHRYNHNLETARSFFPHICTTHTYDDRLLTCQLVKEAGMQLCCGVLLGMGETADQRLELLEDLRALQPEEVPVNFLNPRPGTPLASRSLMSSTEALAWVALFRLGLPGVILRYAGGREVTLGELQALGMRSGVNALIVGNYLTTLGRSPQEDLAMLEELSMPVGALTGVL